MFLEIISLNYGRVASALRTDPSGAQIPAVSLRVELPDMGGT